MRPVVRCSLCMNEEACAAVEEDRRASERGSGGEVLLKCELLGRSGVKDMQVLHVKRITCNVFVCNDLCSAE